MYEGTEMNFRDPWRRCDSPNEILSPSCNLSLYGNLFMLVICGVSPSLCHHLMCIMSSCMTSPIFVPLFCVAPLVIDV